MTAVQKARLAGFNASLAKRGVLLALEGTGFTFNALIQPIDPDAGEFSVSNETRAGSRIHILRESEGIDQVTVGSVLAGGGSVHRVTQVEDHPTNIAIVFHCETALE